MLLRILFLCCLSLPALAEDSTTIKVLFLYGSKPSPAYKKTEPKWFGGILGGHVGIEIAPDRVLSFMPQGQLHIVDKGPNRHSRFGLHTERQFWGIMGYPGEEVKKMTIEIPIASWQKQRLDSLAAEYLRQTPYDYAVVGMRCGSAAHEILSRIGVVEKGYEGRNSKIDVFYPKILRTSLLRYAEKRNWAVREYPGTERRIWEGDETSFIK
ncbi:hypothetical protein [Chitinophaga barathri]|uniref:DUF2459 domain-containing protein n=1 Tax=Chitinophaga barathri TaxID=1647451 RepID=A0A3N4MD58_9BACT|nr:hypothetical protein [Chitinophaga barathri]RPD41862.1 hypothetical protein EG028_06770 [Chitinophaga barathri]